MTTLYLQLAAIAAALLLCARAPRSGFVALLLCLRLAVVGFAAPGSAFFYAYDVYLGGWVLAFTLWRELRAGGRPGCAAAGRTTAVSG